MGVYGDNADSSGETHGNDMGPGFQDSVEAPAKRLRSVGFRVWRHARKTFKDNCAACSLHLIVMYYNENNVNNDTTNSSNNLYWNNIGIMEKRKCL